MRGDEAKPSFAGAEKGTSVYSKYLRKESLLRAKGVPFSASITVEASLVLPLFIFFFVNIMTMFNIVKVQSDLEAALHRTGSEISQMAFDVRSAGKVISGGSDSRGQQDAKDTGSEDGSAQKAGETIAGILSVPYAAGKVREYLGSGIEKSVVTNGSAGISFLESKVMLGNDIVDIVADYKVHPLIPIIGFSEFPIQGRYYGHAWTGYDVSGGSGTSYPPEEYVYITEHGEVYHRDINCKHLRLSVKSVPFDEIGNFRNKDSAKFYPCTYCGKGLGGGNVFITDYGNRYHSTTDCIALKRKIYTVPLSEVGGRGPCKNCG